MNCDRLARWYRWLEYAGMGRALERRRFEFLADAARARRILVLGEGDGRFLAALLRVNDQAQIDVVDNSREMLALARRRAGMQGQGADESNPQWSSRLKSEGIEMAVTPTNLASSGHLEGLAAPVSQTPLSTPLHSAQDDRVREDAADLGRGSCGCATGIKPWGVGARGKRGVCPTIQRLTPTGQALDRTGATVEENATGPIGMDVGWLRRGVGPMVPGNHHPPPEGCREQAPGTAMVRFWCADARDWQPPDGTSYDLIVTHFFLDCFTDEALGPLVAKLARAARPGGCRWLVSEFRLPDRGLAAWRARVWVGGLYRAFGLATGLRVRRLPDYSAALQANGFRRERQVVAEWGLLVSERWSRGEAFTFDAPPGVHLQSRTPPSEEQVVARSPTLE